MFQKNKLKVILSSIIILLPALFGVIMWQDLPDRFATHFGTNGNADGFSGKAFTVFGLPCILLVFHFICLLFTLLDKKQKEQSKKALGMTFWYIPIVSLLVNGFMYRTALGKETDLTIILPILLGIMFIFMGNYMPKVKPNRTLGIRVWWALNNEENWNKTHRFGGKVWVAGGLILLFLLFLPLTNMVWFMLSVIVAVVFIPIIYSYCIYRQHQKIGTAYTASPKSKTGKISTKLSAIFVALILIAVAILLFTGNIEVHCEDTSLKIKATFWTDLDINYSEIDSVTYRQNLDVGERSFGIGSAILSLGTFENAEFGSYTLYAYTDAETFIVLTLDKKTLVIGMRDAKDTQTIYDTLSARIAQ